LIEILPRPDPALICTVDTARMERPLLRPAANEHAKPPKVLVVDDDRLHQTLIAHLLAVAGFDISTASNGREALEVAQRVEPDAVILDAEMPEMDGFDMIEVLRRDPALETLPTLMVSGRADQEARLRAFEMGVDDFIAKPVDGDDLIARVRAHLRVANAWTGRVRSLSTTVRDTLIAEGALASAGDPRFEQWLDRLIETAAFDIWFQPIVDMRTGRVVAQEALTRFHDGSSPAHVFEKVADSDRAVTLELVLVEASITAAASLAHGTRLHVNVSPPTTAAPELSELIDLSDRQVVLEMTERNLFGAEAARQLRMTLPVGSLLAADDVGAGYSGLSQLLEVRPDILKIDRMVVAGIDADPARQALVAGLVRFAELTGSTIVAEGIERAGEARSLLELGVEIGQGYHFCRPAPLVEAAATVVCPVSSDGNQPPEPSPRQPVTRPS